MVMLDNTSSMLIQKGVYDGEVSYSTMLRELNFEQFERANFEYFTIGSGTRQIPSTDSLTLSESETNLVSALTQIRELEDDFDAVIFATDGIITFGRNPILQAADLTIPLYTIGLGDTSTVRDIYINNIATNSTGYTSYRQTVEVEVAQNGFENASTLLELRNSANTLLDSTTISFQDNNEVQLVEFELSFEEKGLQQYTITALPIEGEWSKANNQHSFSVEVLDSKTRILHFAFEIHPDVKMLRSLLLTDPNIELTTKTWLGGNRFVENDPIDFSEYDLIIYHGLPSEGTPLPQPLDVSIPTWYLELPKTRTKSASFSNLAILDNFGGQLFELGLSPQVDNTEHPIMELPEVDYFSLAPIISSIRIRQLQPDAQILFNSTFQDVETSNPVLAVTERGGLRRVHTTAWNWYKLYQSTSPEERAFISTLFSNIASWASNNPDDRRLKINLAKPIFSIAEDVIINADLINESGNPEAAASIEITLGTENEQRIFNMQNLGGGRYKLEIQALGPGVYSFEATARKGDRTIDVQQGEFVVEQSNIELMNTIRNDELLKALAQETGGRNYIFANVSGLWGDLERDGVLQTKIETVESYHFPVRNVFWFILVLALLGTEWFLRKVSSLP